MVVLAVRLLCSGHHRSGRGRGSHAGARTCTRSRPVLRRSI